MGNTSLEMEVSPLSTSQTLPSVQGHGDCSPLATSNCSSQLDSGNKSEVVLVLPGIISDTGLFLIRFILGFGIQTIVQLFGMCTNTINLLVFCKTGLRDSVTISFFALAMAHFWYLLFYFIARVCFALDNLFFFRPHVDLGVVSYLVGMYSNMFLTIAIIITVYMSVQKCCCVAIPFLFKDMFTRSRSTAVVVIIYLATICYFMPSFVSQGLKPKFISSENRTILTYTNLPSYVTFRTIYQIFNGMVLIVLSQALVLISLLILTVKLKQFTKFRNSASTNLPASRHTKLTTSKNGGHVGSTDQSSDASMTPGLGLKAEYPGIAAVKQDKEDKLSGKELRVVQAVYVTAALFVICNIGEIPLKFAGFVEPEFQDVVGRRYFNLHSLLSTLQGIAINVGAGSNIFIYISYNTRFQLEFSRSFLGKN